MIPLTKSLVRGVMEILGVEGRQATVVTPMDLLRECKERKENLDGDTGRKEKGEETTLKLVFEGIDDETREAAMAELAAIETKRAKQRRIEGCITVLKMDRCEWLFQTSP